LKSSKKARKNENSYFITPSYSTWLDDLFT
jgi:hypothetical protein